MAAMSTDDEKMRKFEWILDQKLGGIVHLSFIYLLWLLDMIFFPQAIEIEMILVNKCSRLMMFVLTPKFLFERETSLEHLNLTNERKWHFETTFFLY